MTGPAITPTTSTGRRRVSDATRARLREVNRAKWAAMTDEQRAAMAARIGRTPKPSGRAGPTATDSPPGGPRNPLDDAPRARVGRDPSPEGRPLGAPPRFVIPDLPPLEPAATADELADLPQPTADELAGFTVDPDHVADAISMVFDFVADRRGDWWRLKPLERERLSGALARKINEHAAVARVLGAGGDWILIFGGFAVVISARLAEDARHAHPDTGSGARPGFAGITLPGRNGSGPGRGAPAPAASAGPAAVRVDGESAGPGTLNGFRTVASGDVPEAAAEGARRLTQSFGGG